jgi:hypothetical protein
MNPHCPSTQCIGSPAIGPSDPESCPRQPKAHASCTAEQLDNLRENLPRRELLSRSSLGLMPACHGFGQASVRIVKCLHDTELTAHPGRVVNEDVFR